MKLMEASMSSSSSASFTSSSDPITGDFLQQALDALRREIYSTLHVAMPGTVTAYDASDGTVSVRPALRRRTSSDPISGSLAGSSARAFPGKGSGALSGNMAGVPSGQILTAPILPRVPVLLPSPDFVPAPGDPCLLIFCDFCLDGFLDTGQPVLPPSPRSHDLSDAFALVGFCPAVRNLTGRENP